MKKAFIPLALATALFTTGCKDSENIIDTPSTPDLNDHEAISFTMADGQGASSTRAFYAEGLTRAGFNGNYGTNSEQPTQILMHIESKNGAESTWKYTKTQATASPEVSSAGYSTVSFPEAYLRYWDDAHGRNSLLSVYAVAIPNKSTLGTGSATNNAIIEEGDLTAATSGDWGNEVTTEPKHEINWTVSKAQNATTLYTEDLVYSNNIQASGKDGLYWFDYANNTWKPGTATSHTPTGETSHGDGCMQFRLSNPDDSRSAGKFDKGHLNFKHALSRITIKLVEGTGFDHSTDKTDFKFSDATYKTVNLYAMNYTGTLDLKAGTWSNTTAISADAPIRIATGDHNSTTNTSVTPTTYISNYQCSAQVLPDYELSNSSEVNVLDFTIDDNTYFIQNKMLWDALNKNAGTGTGKNGLDASATSYKMQQGKNYVFTITVDKKQIESVTATIVAWSDVEAANVNINNTHVSFTTYSASDETAITEGLHLFRLAEILSGGINTSTEPDAHNYSGAYTDEAKATYSATNSKWSTDWFYENNKTAYHFRALNNVACYGTSGTTEKSNFNEGNTAFNMYNGAATSNDYHWGAPLTVATGTKYYEYSTSKGYEALLHKGITSTMSDINITMLHMMSQINVIVRTTDKTKEGDADVNASNAIALEDGTNQCVVTLTRLYNHGTVDMGTGLITIDQTTNDATNQITTGVKTSETMTAPTTGITSNNEAETNRITIDNKKYSTKQTGKYTFNVIPQTLYRGTKTGTDIATDNEDYFVGITIKTPDNNQYYVVKRLSEIKATAIGTSQNQANNSEIKYWYPNHSYTYTFTITKKGIESITCTLADWVNVTGENINIDLES